MQQSTLISELKDAIAPRTVLLVAGTLVLQLAFIASYVGAFHDPTPHSLDVGVVAPEATAQQITAQLDALDGSPVSARRVADRDEALSQVRAGDLAAALVVDPRGTADELVVASGGGASVVTSVEQAAQQLAAQQGRTFTTTDAVPLESGDARGLTGFYLVIGWIIGGYLMAALLGVSKGARPANPSRAAIRLLSAVPYAVVAGLGGAFVVDQWLGALTGHFWELAALGALLVFASAAVTTALQVLFGVLGIGLTVLVFVVLGNPSAGGAFQWSLLPAFWRDLGPWLPNGAGTEAVRRIVYFGAESVTAQFAVIAVYAVAGAALTMLAAWWHSRAGEQGEQRERRAHAGAHAA